MRFWLSCVCLLLLGACDDDLVLFSSSPVIPEEELAKPENLGGAYWTLDVPEPSDIGIVKWQWQDGKTALFYLEEDDEQRRGEVRLAELPALDAYLLLQDLSASMDHSTEPQSSNCSVTPHLCLASDPEDIAADDNEAVPPWLADGKLTIYGLLKHLDHGIYASYASVIDGTSSFAEQNFAYLAKVASQHGFTLASDKETVTIDGPLDGTGILELFRDSAFLGALKVEPSQYLLPMALDLPVTETAEVLPRNQDEGWKPNIGVVDLPQLARGQLARPEGFASSYFSGKGSSENPDVQLRQLLDGRFELSGSKEGRLRLLSLDDDVARYVGISHDDETVETAIDKLLLISHQDEGCWSFVELQEQPKTSIAELDEMKADLLREAARRHGLVYDHEYGHLSGGLDGDSLVALLRDGQFTSGLDDGDEFTLCPRPHK